MVLIVRKHVFRSWDAKHVRYLPILLNLLIMLD